MYVWFLLNFYSQGIYTKVCMVFVKLFVSYFQLFHVMNLGLVSFILVVEGKNACMTLLNFYSQGLSCWVYTMRGKVNLSQFYPWLPLDICERYLECKGKHSLSFSPLISQTYLLGRSCCVELQRDTLLPWHFWH
jgi:hypothetical protein